MIDTNSHTEKTKPLPRLPDSHMENVLHAIADGVIVQNTFGRIIFANQAAAKLMGYENEAQLVNTPTEDILSRFEVRDEFDEPYNLEWLPGRLALKGEPNPSTTIRFRPIGSLQDRWALVKARPIYDNDQVVMAVNIFQDITRTKWVEQYQNFLAQAGEILSSSLDYSTTLNSVADLAVDQLADWCVVNVLEEDDTLQLIAIAHREPAMVDLAKELQMRYASDDDESTGISGVVSTGKAKFFPHITEEALKEVARDEDHFNKLSKIGMNSAMILPLTARGRTLGAISLIWAESGRQYNNTEKILGQELARRAGIAIDNARLYRKSQILNEELEDRVAQRTDQLHSLINTLRGEIEERKKATQELLEKETILNTLFESAPDGQVLVNEDGEIVRVNTQIEELFGTSREELLGQPIEILLHDRYQYRHVSHRLKYMGEPLHRPMGSDKDLYGKRKDGREFPIDIMLSPVNTPKENLVIASVRDISERVQMEAELAEVQRRLLENVEAERLSLSQDLHDGPIQELYGVTYNLKDVEELLNGSQGSSSTKELLDDTRDVINQVIQSLRVTCGELRPPSLAPFGLEKAIRAHIEPIQQNHPELDIQIELIPDGQMLPERVRLALYRIYQNAVSNVLRHSQASHLIVRLLIEEEQVFLEIEDDGQGFELPTRWVEMARQGHLGLVGAHERVKAIGGNLKVTSAIGEGTRIQVSVPRDK